MFWTNVKRILRTGLFNFWRNGFVSLASVLVMVAALFVIGSIIFLGAMLDSSLTELRNKVDVNVYFVTTAQESDVLSIKDQLEQLPEVASVVYVSREEALAAFRERHANDQTTLQALDELGENPLGAVLNVKAREPSQYEGIANFLQGDRIISTSGIPVIDKVNYYQNKEAIDKLTRLIGSADKLGLVLTIVLVVMSVLITFNTIRLAIYISREEIAVMRLVGATPGYVRGPFVVSGIIYGAVAGFITLALFYPATYWLGDITENFFIGLNLFDYYISNFGQIFLIVVGSGMAIGAVSSYLAVRKYLKV